MDLKLVDKIALVTGSSGGIGLAAATALAREGAQVIVNGRDESRLNKAIHTVNEAVPGSRIHGVAADLASAAGCEELIHTQRKVDILVNNLGIYRRSVFEDTEDDEWLRFFETNVMSGVRLTRHYIAGMKERNWGRIVFVSSESARHIPADMIHYGVSKTAQVAVARGIAETLCGTAVTCNSVLVGPTWSDGAAAIHTRRAKDAGISRAEMEKGYFESARPTSLLRRFLRG